MTEPTHAVSAVDLLRWAEALSGIARTGLGFTQSLYERERFEEVLKVAADIRVAAAARRRGAMGRPRVRGDQRRGARGRLRPAADPAVARRTLRDAARTPG